uniref:Uncharacterized protein n=1 Tax=Trichinella nativa TaxID=6335 RepID=A0A0V1KIE2_9BILA
MSNLKLSKATKAGVLNLPSENTGIYIMIHHSSKITVMK